MVRHVISCSVYVFKFYNKNSNLIIESDYFLPIRSNYYKKTSECLLLFDKAAYCGSYNLRTGTERFFTISCSIGSKHITHIDGTVPNPFKIDYNF